MQKSNLIWGILLIILGLFFFAGNITRIGIEDMWPVFPLAMGLFFLTSYFSNRKNYGLLMPASVLLVISALFFYCNFEGWWHMEDLWPIFILAPALGFFAMYFGGKFESGLLVPAGILTVVGVIFLFINSGIGEYWPVLLILAGALILVKHYLLGSQDKEDSII